ncbi:ankyrin repeat domain-containing protein [Wolbachia pipientis]|nr:ankyrin repeat domain-containing protein [Wolbachia pipientis]
MLLSKKVNVNSIDSNGKTPLHEAAASGHKEIVDALIKAGADGVP